MRSTVPILNCTETDAQFVDSTHSDPSSPLELSLERPRSEQSSSSPTSRRSVEEPTLER